MTALDLIIIGAGPSGLAAGLYAQERKLKTIILEAEVPGGQLVRLYPNKDIYDYPSYPAIKARVLSEKITKHALELGVEIVTHTIVNNVKPGADGFEVVTNQHSYFAKVVLLATGMGNNQPRQLHVKGEPELTGKGIYYQTLPEKLVGKRIIVIGGGDTAFETAVTAAEKGATVALVHRSTTFRALEKTVDKARTLTIPLYLSAQVVSFQGTDRVEAVEIVRETGATTILSADIVIICIGTELNRTFLTQLGITTNNQAVVVNADMMTSIKGVFACGDITVPAGKYKRISVAVGTSATAINGVYQYLKNPI